MKHMSLKNHLVILFIVASVVLIILPHTALALEYPETPANGLVVVCQADRPAETTIWYSGIPGDYDQNGEVNIADLTPLGKHLGETQESTGIDWTLETVQSVIDGDGNYEINISDIAVIGQNYGLTIDGWELYDTDGNLDIGDGNTIARVAFSEAIGNPATERIWFEANLPTSSRSPFLYVDGVLEGNLLGRPALVSESSDHPARLYVPHQGLRWDTESNTLVVVGRLPGDCDSNGQVSLADITVIGMNYGSQVDQSQVGTRSWLADCDGNGSVEEADLRVIAYNLHARQEGYLLYTTMDPGELPAPYSVPVHQPIPFAALTDGSMTIASGQYFWVRPYVGDPTIPINIGAPSEIVQVP